MKSILQKIFITLLIVSFLTVNVAAQENHDDVDGCDTASQFVEIKADKDNSGALAFDLSEIRLDKDTCVELTFKNLSGAVEHDFTVDEDTDNGFQGVHVHLLNNLGGDNGTDTKKVLFQTPNVDITYEFYCSVTGHRESGMSGDLIIGDGSKVPGFEISLTIFAIMSMIAIPIIKKKRN